MSSNRFGVVLVGHGGLPSDCPEELISKLKRLESARRKGNLPITDEEIEIDRKIRYWPRNPKTDPYQAGLEEVAKFFKSKLGECDLEVAYNEFCKPTIGEAVENLIYRNINDITILSTMFTPGGSHAELEIPEEVEDLKKSYPEVSIDYAWPFELQHIAEFLTTHISINRKNKNLPPLNKG